MQRDNMSVEQGPRITIYKRKTNQQKGILWNWRIQQLQLNSKLVVAKRYR
jgi:hypothetical protein